jgi:hypothetical protein
LTYVQPKALIHCEDSGTYVVKRFVSADACEVEARWYRKLPDLCPELIAQEGPDLVTRRHPTAWDTPAWRDPMALFDLILAVNSHGVQHRDVHLRNIVLVDGSPRLIDWFTAIEAPVPVSYDLYGSASLLPRPEGHVDYQCWTTPNKWSIREAWGVDVPTCVDQRAYLWGVET